MKKLLKTSMFAAIFLILAGGLTSCEKKTEEFFYEIYSLDFPNCYWEHHDIYNEVTIINNIKELEKHIDCRQGHFFPAIDFRRNTLLLAQGITIRGAGRIEISLLQNCILEYTLKATVFLGASSTVAPWTVGVLTYKIPNSATINLEVEIVQ
jgi:hypothetical protein